MRNLPYLPPTPTSPEGYTVYRTKVLVHRMSMERKATYDKNAQAQEIVRCADDPGYFMAVYGTIYEARPKTDDDDRAGAGFIPFVPYPFQIEVIDWFEQRMKAKGRLADGVIVKSRDMGLSNIAVFWIAWRWLFSEPFQARLLSRKEDLVDARGNPDSLFWKLDTFLKGLPEWLFRAGVGGTFDWRKHRTKLKLVNPRNGNLVGGESTQQHAGRGGRASVVVLDEAAFMPEFGRIWTGLRAATNHRIAISTVSLEQGMDFYNLHHGKEGYDRPAILEIPWNLHPLHDEAWFRNELARDSIAGIKREVLMDYFAGGGNWCYPLAQRKDVSLVDYDPYAGPLTVAIDDGFDKDGAAILIQYHVKTGRHRVIAAVVAAGKTADWWGSILTGAVRSDFDYDEESLQFARLMRQLPGVSFVGDAHVRDRNNVTGSSFQEHLAKHWNIHIISNNGMRGQLTKAERIDKLSMILPVMDFNDVPSVVYVLEALKRNQFKKRREGHTESNEQRSDIHDWTSHPTSALEYYAYNFEEMRFLYLGKTINWRMPDNE